MARQSRFRRPARPARERPGRRSQGTWVVFLLVAFTLGTLAALWVRSRPNIDREPLAAATQQTPLSRPGVIRLTDDQIRRAVDAMLAEVNPDLPSNSYFPEFARQQLRWLNQENRVGRLAIQLYPGTPPLPPDVVMVSMSKDGHATIFVSKTRFAEDLLNGGRITPPFTLQERNDFLIALVHEVVHLQNPTADPIDPVARAGEEMRVWREVNTKVVRDLRQKNQPMNERFVEVDDALRRCRDMLPCPELEKLVRLQPL